MILPGGGFYKGTIFPATGNHAVRVSLEFVRDLDNPDDDFVGIAILVQQAEFYHGIVFADVALHVDDLVVLQMFLQFILENVQGIGKINFQRTGIIGRCLHRRLS